MSTTRPPKPSASLSSTAKKRSNVPARLVETECSAQCTSVAPMATTGDTGYIDEDRYLYLVDRSSSLIITGGVNIYPQEIENALALHPDVRDVAVVGEPEEELGEVVVAYLEPEDHVRPEQNLGEEVRQWLDGRLSRFKIPRRLHTIDALPRSPTGKLVKRKLDPSRALS